MDTDSSTTTTDAPAGEKRRLVSLDVFRGITIAGMILVNNQGNWSAVYAPVRHAAWNGLTLADLVFPFFIFIMGASIPLSLSGKPGEIRRVLRRTAILLMLGLFLNTLILYPGFDFSTMRFPGVLQRIALCYCFAAVATIALGERGRGVLAAGLLTGYGLLLLFVTPEGFGHALLTPSENICRFVDSLIFGSHTYEHAPVPGFDPEGLLSTIPAIGTALIGVFAGEWLKERREGEKHIRSVLATAALTLAAGLALHPFLPVNKNLWTPSYVLVTGGIALAALAVLYWMIERRGWTRAVAPFIWLGRNAILAYLLSSASGRLSIVIRLTNAEGAQTTLKGVLHDRLFASWLDPYAASLAYAGMHLLVWTGVLYILYRKDVVVKF